MAGKNLNLGSGLMNFFNKHKNKTFRPRKSFEEGTIKHRLHKQASASLHSGIDLQEVVKLPPGEDRNDWIAVHVVDFFNRINMLYGTISENCTEQSCPVMSGGPRFEYHWCDGVTYKRPTPLPAPKYISLLMEWVEAQINNEDVFPVECGNEKADQAAKSALSLPPTDCDLPFTDFKPSVGVEFPKSFIPIVKKILTRLFRVFVHVYIHHFENLLALDAEAHVNTCYKHFYYFIREYELVDKKELEPLKDMTAKICH